MDKTANTKKIVYDILYRINSVLILIVLINIHGIHPVYSAICYDITTNHKCTQQNNSSKNSSEFKNSNLKKKYSIEVPIKSLSDKQSCGYTTAYSETNITDLYKAIEAAQLNQRTKFVCKMETKIRIQNETTLDDRNFMKNYIEKRRSNKSINKEDTVKMTALLMKYRLLRNKNNACGSYQTSSGECYFSTARFNAPEEIFAQINEAAKKYVSQSRQPNTCLFNGTEFSLTSPECENEILSRVQAIPAPLILAQAAQESGWGSPDSKWVKEYNNYLGLQIKFNQPKTMSCYKNCRCAGTTKARCALKFTDASGSIYDYSMRFNASPLPAYKEFRKTRQTLNNMSELDSINNQCNNARQLVPHLKVYAEETHYMSFICNQLNENICEMLKKCPKYQLKYQAKKS